MAALLTKRAYFSHEVFARLAQNGTKVPTTVIDAFGDISSIYNITGEYVSGPELGAVLREIYRRMLTVGDVVMVIDQIASLVEASDRKDWSLAGYNSESAYLDATRPFGLDRTTCSSLMSFYRKVIPLIQKLEEGINPVTIFVDLPRSTIIRLIKLYTSGINNSGVGLITDWVMMGGMSQTIIDELTSSSLITSWVALHERLERAGINSREAFRELGPIGRDGHNYVTDGIQKAMVLARFLLSSDYPDAEITKLFEDVKGMPTEAVYRLGDMHHGRSKEHTAEEESFLDDDEEVPTTPKTRKHNTTPDDIVYTSGDDDQHTPLVLKVQIDGAGWAKIIEGGGSARSLQTLQRRENVKLVDAISGRSFRFGADLKPVFD